MYPLSIVEAMASKVPFISTDVGCVRGLPGGIIVKSANEMSYFIDLLFYDTDLANQISNVGNNYSKKYQTIEKKVLCLNNKIMEILGDSCDKKE